MKLHEKLLLGSLLTSAIALGQTKPGRVADAFYKRTIEVLTTTGTDNLGEANNEAKFAETIGEAVPAAVSATDKKLNDVRVVYVVNRNYTPALDAADTGTTGTNSVLLSDWVAANGNSDSTYMLFSQSPNYSGWTATPGVEESSFGASGYAGVKGPLHELGHMLGGLHSDGITGISGNVYQIMPDGSEVLVNSPTDLETIMQNGIPGGTDTEVFSTSAINNIGHSSNGGNGTWSREFTQGGNNYRLDIDVNQLDNGGNNVSDYFRNDFINNPSKYEVVPVDPNTVSPIPNIQIVEVGGEQVYKLMNPTDFENVVISATTTDPTYQSLYFVSGDHRIFPYEAGIINDGDHINGDEGFTVQELADGRIPVSSLPAGDKQFASLELISNSLGSVSSIITLSTTDHEFMEGITMHPNPAVNIVEFKDEMNLIKDIMISDLNGRNIHYDLYDAQNKTLDISNLASGTYLATIFDKNNKVLGTKKFIKE